MFVNKKYPKRYTAGLSKKDKEKQKKQLDKSTRDYKEGKYKYVPLGLGLRWYRTTDDKFVIFNSGIITNIIENITFC